MGRAVPRPLVGRQDGICGGRPTIIGRRIEVSTIVERMAGGDTPAELVQELGLDSEKQVLACLKWAANAVEQQR